MVENKSNYIDIIAKILILKDKGSFTYRRDKQRGTICKLMV